MTDPLDDFIRDVIEDCDAGVSRVDEAVAGGRASGLGELPGHRVEALIARGGMGAVYRASQQALEREVAVKVMSAEAGSPEMAARFRREARVLGKLAHPNVVPIYDIGTDDEGQVFYSMKLVKGRTLQAILDELRREEGSAAEIPREHSLVSLLTVFLKVCDALAFAHSLGIIHRDLKPENIMVGEFGEVLVMDWGLAKLLGEGESRVDAADGNGVGEEEDLKSMRTLDGAVMGTPHYMSPEQARGKIDELDERSDVYSLGGILYAILTLRPPVAGTTLEEVLRKVESGRVTAPSDLQTGSRASGERQDVEETLEASRIKPLPHVEGGRVPSALSSVVMKALQLEKGERYQGVTEFAADVEAYQGGFATTAEQAGLATQLVLLVKRHKSVFSTASAALLLVATLAAWFVIGLRAKERRAVAGEEAAGLSSAKANLALAESALGVGDGPGMRAALEEVPEGLRDSTWRYLAARTEDSLKLAGADTRGIAADPTRPGVFAVADPLGGVSLRDARTDERLSAFTAGFANQDGNGYMRLAFSPDGEHIAIGRSRGAGGIVIHRARDGKKLIEWEARVSLNLEFNADGSLLMQRSWIRPEILLAVWEASSGQLLWQYVPERDDCFGAFTPDGKQALVFGAPDGLRLVQARDGKLVRRLLTEGDVGVRTDARLTAMALNGNDLMAIADMERKISVINWKEERIVSLFGLKTSEISESVRHLAWTRDGQQVVVAAALQDNRQIIRKWNAYTGAEVRSLLGGHGYIESAAVHPLSDDLVISGKVARAWRLSGASPKWQLIAAPGAPFSFWGADDLVFGPWPSFRASVVKLDAAGGAGKALWSSTLSAYNLVSVSADGRWAAVCSEHTSTNPILILNRSGDEVEQVTSIEPSLHTRRMRLSPDGKQLITLNIYRNRRVDRLSTANGETLATLEQPEFSGFNDIQWLSSNRIVGAVTAHKERQLPASEEWVVLWDADTAEVLKTVPHSTAMDVIAVAPDGTRFAEAGADKMVRIRDASTLAILQEFRVHDGPILSLAWHPSRALLATASTDLTLRVWNLETEQMVEEMRGWTEPFRQLGFSPGGQRLGGVLGDRRVFIWEPESLRPGGADR